MDAQSNLGARRRRISWQLVCWFAMQPFLLAACLIVGVGSIKWWEGIPERNVAQMLADDGPRTGATRKEVETWLDRRGIQHSRRKDMEDRGEYPGEQPPSRFDDLSPGIQGEYIVGKLYAADLHRGTGGEIWIYFFFDSKGQLIQHIVKRWYGWL